MWIFSLILSGSCHTRPVFLAVNLTAKSPPPPPTPPTCVMVVIAPGEIGLRRFHVYVWLPLTEYANPRNVLWIFLSWNWMVIESVESYFPKTYHFFPEHQEWDLQWSFISCFSYTVCTVCKTNVTVNNETLVPSIS